MANYSDSELNLLDQHLREVETLNVNKQHMRQEAVIHL